MTKTRVYLCWYSAKPIDCRHLSELAGIHPTRIEEKGSPILHRDGSPVHKMGKDGQWTTALHKENALTYELPPYRGWKVYNLLKKMMQTIQHHEELGDYCKANGISAKLVIVIEGITDTYSMPVFTFSKEFVSFLSKINAWVDFDFYMSPFELKETPEEIKR